LKKLAFVLVLVLIAGCGGSDRPSDEDQIETTLTTYYKAFGDGDSPTACNQLADKTREALEQAAGGEDCEKVLERALKKPDYARIAPKLADVKISAINVAAGKATAKATVPGVGSTTTVPLEKENGTWKIAAAIGETD
jgi:hypothetical protein